MERVLVIGGTGAIGSRVVRRLADDGRTVAILSRGITQREPPRSVLRLLAPDAPLPLTHLPAEATAWCPTVVVHMLAMGEPDARACVEAFGHLARRCVLISSGDVYAAYGRFLRLESGPPERGLLSETSATRSALFPYRRWAVRPAELEHWYDKLLAEKEIAAAPWEWVILRLPKVYGPGINEELRTIYGFRHQPDWRWTHGHVENVAEAVALAAVHPAASRRIYNLGEPVTPSMGQRLSRLPPRDLPLEDTARYDFAHHLAYDTRRVREELSFREAVDEDEGMLRMTLGKKG
jgi:nucleoside-diphosphate-sugar epimerase